MKNAYELLARRQKADKLLAVIKKFDGTVDDVRSMTEEDWANAAKLADVKPPSQETKNLVREILAESEMEDLCGK